MVTSKSEKYKSANETISEKLEKSGKIREKSTFFRGGGCKSTLSIIGKGKKMDFIIIKAIMV
jgi:hypothetical protein